MPAWLDFSDERGGYSLPDLENRGFKLAFDRHGPPFDPDSGERAVMGLSDPGAGIRPAFVPSPRACAAARPAIPFVGAGPNFVPTARTVQTVREFVR